MSLAAFNKTNTDWGIDTKELEFIEPEELEGEKKIALLGFWINKKSKYDPHPILIVKYGKDGNIALMDAPAHTTEQFEAIQKEPGAIELIKKGSETFHLEKFTSTKYQKDSYRVVLD